MLISGIVPSGVYIMKSTFFSLLAVAAFVYVCFCVYLYVFQRSFIYFPTPVTEGVPAEEAWIENDGERVRLWRLHPALPFVHDVVYLAYRADVHRTRAAIRLKDALVEYGRGLGCDEESQRLQQEGIEGEAPKPPGRRGRKSGGSP